MQLKGLRSGISSHRLRLAAFVLAAIASVVLSIVPIYSGMVTATDAAGRTKSFDLRARLVEVNGARGVLWLVLAPLVFVIPLIVKRAKIPVGVLMLLFALAAFSTIGMFYLPSAVLLWPGRPEVLRVE